MVKLTCSVAEVTSLSPEEVKKLLDTEGVPANDC